MVPSQLGTATSLAYQPPAGVVAEFHSHGSSRAFFSATDDRDEQGFRIYGVAGRLDTPLPELSLRVGVYGHFAPVEWSQVFDGPHPGVRLVGEEPESTRNTESEDKEVELKMPYYLDNAFLLDNPWITVVGCGGTGGFVAEGLCRLFQGREATIVLVDHDRVEPHNLLRQNFYAEDVGKFKSQALADRLARDYRRPVGYSVYPFREDGLPLRWGPLPRPSLLRELPAHRLRRQRRRTAGRWPSPCRATRAGGSSTRATTPTGDRCSSATSPTGTLGTNKPSSTRPATCCQRPRCSGPTC